MTTLTLHGQEAVAIHFSHPWHEIFWIFGIAESQMRAEDMRKFSSRFGGACESEGDLKAARQWLWTNCPHLRTKMMCAKAI